VTRIIAGSRRGRTLVVPAGRETRPTSDRVREALFSRLEHEGVVDGARVLDLYAGSGALGLEAASRGAARVLLVDSGREAARACRRNVTDLGLDDVATVQQVAVGALLGAAPDRRYDLVLLDPPYALAEEELAAVLVRLADGWLDERAVLVLERGTRGPEPAWPAGLVRFDQRRYGETTLWFAEPTVEPAEGQ
jgi:16S rRNA (guanine966-N2)-methyltransferase